MAKSRRTTRLPPLLRPLRPLRLLLVLAIAVLCVGVVRVSGLYEDQVGTYDWVQPRIGGVRFAAFLTSSQRKRVLVGTDRNVIAALNLRTGDVAWRRVLGDKDTLHALDMGGRYLVTVSGTEAAAVRAWAVPDGTLAWETMLPLPAAAAAGDVMAKFVTIPAADGSSADRVVVLLGSAAAAAAAATEVHCVSAATGEVLWSATLPSHAHSISLLPQGSILLTSLSPSLAFSLTTLDAASGKVTASAASPTSSSSSSASFSGHSAAYVTATGTAVAVDSASGNILTAALVTSVTADATADATAATVQVHSTPLASLLPKEHHQSGVSAAVVPEKAPGSFFWLAVPGAVFLLSARAADGQAGSAGQVSLVDSFPGLSAVSASVMGGAAGAAGAGGAGGEGGEGGSFYSGLVGSQGSGDTLKFHMQVHQLLPSSSSPPALLSDSVSVPLHRAPPVRVFLNAYARAAGAGGRGRGKDEKVAGEGKAGAFGFRLLVVGEDDSLSLLQQAKGEKVGKTGAFGFRLLVVGEDDSLSLLQQGEVVWEREEALASVVAVAVAELPEEEEELSVAAVEHDIYEWARTHLLRAKVSLNLGSAEEQALVHRLRTASPEKIKPFRDRNGFRRILLLLTAPGGGNGGAGGGNGGAGGGNGGAGGGSGGSGGNSGRGMGKLFALHSGDGRVLWAAALPSGGSSGGRGASVFSPEALVLWRDPHRTSPDQTPEALVLQIRQQKQQAEDEKVAHAALVTIVNGHTGDVLESKGLPFVPRLVSPLPLVGKDERRLVMLVEKVQLNEAEEQEAEGVGKEGKEETDGNEKGGAAAGGAGGKARRYGPVRVHVFPGTEEARGLFEGHKKEVFFYLVDTVTGAVEGYSIGEEVKEEGGSSGSEGRSDGGRLGGGVVYGAVLVWRVVLPADSEIISAIAAPKREESQHTQVQALGDRSVQFKLLSKTLLIMPLPCNCPQNKHIFPRPPPFTPSPSQSQHTQVRALGDRSVQFKLLSKNLLFLATVTPPAAAAASASASAGAAGAGGEEGGAVVVYLVDTVGGQVVERVVHSGMQGPVHAVSVRERGAGVATGAGGVVVGGEEGGAVVVYLVDTVGGQVVERVVKRGHAGTRARGAAGAGGEEGGLAVVYLVDTVGGQVVERVVHAGMQGPVHAVMAENWVVYHYFNPAASCFASLANPYFLVSVLLSILAPCFPGQVMAENWVVYHYFNPAASRHEVSTIELLDTSLKDVPVIDYLKYGLSIPGSSNLTAPLSAAEIPWERVKRLRQSYYFPYALRCISVTSTLAGITNKHVLFGTALDQVLALDRRFLDPRRVPEPSQQDKEAGIMPYSDSLPAPGQAYLTHRYRIEGLKHILSFPTRLESTTLVLAHGLDLFFVRTAPSRVFDSLGEDFSFALLLGTIAVLSIAIVVTWGLSRKQELKQRWK
ncbi:unnamed protein product [Closterium sp. NIES-64]|nr:unnamed protein product [Closterium sp. NIES-64]